MDNDDKSYHCDLLQQFDGSETPRSLRHMMQVRRMVVWSPCSISPKCDKLKLEQFPVIEPERIELLSAQMYQRPGDN